MRFDELGVLIRKKTRDHLSPVEREDGQEPGAGAVVRDPEIIHLIGSHHFEPGLMTHHRETAVIEPGQACREMHGMGVPPAS